MGWANPGAVADVLYCLSPLPGSPRPLCDCGLPSVVAPTPGCFTGGRLAEIWAYAAATGAVALAGYHAHDRIRQEQSRGVLVPHPANFNLHQAGSGRFGEGSLGQYGQAPAHVQL